MFLWERSTEAAVSTTFQDERVKLLFVCAHLQTSDGFRFPKSERKAEGQAHPPLVGFYRCAKNLRTNDRCWGLNRFAGNFLEPSMFKLHPGFAVGVAAIAQSLPKRCYQILNASQAGPPRRCDVLNKHEFPARFQNA